MTLTDGERLHATTRRLFGNDQRRHFVGEVTAVSEVAVRLEGYAFVYDPSSVQYVRKPDRRVRVLGLGDSGHIINVLPADVDIDRLSYRVAPPNHRVLTDGGFYSLDINEFSTSRQDSAAAATALWAKVPVDDGRFQAYVPASQLPTPCLACGACCAAFRVSFYWSESDGGVSDSVPEDMTCRVGLWLCAMKGTDHVHPRCVALVGEPGVGVWCSIYERRPSVCREVAPSGQDGLANIWCDRARAIWGLPPLMPVRVGGQDLT